MKITLSCIISLLKVAETALDDLYVENGDTKLFGLVGKVHNIITALIVIRDKPKDEN